MTCLICKHGETKAGHTTATIQRNGCTVIFKNVPADICENCGEFYTSEDTTREMLRRADIAAENGAEHGRS